MAETEIKQVVTIDTKQPKKTLGDLKREIKELKGELLGLTEGSEEYNRVLVEVADRQHELSEITRQVSASSRDFGDKMSNVSGTLSGVTGGIQTVVSGLSLMGVEMGDDVKMLKTLQALMAMTSGIQAIDSGVKSFKALTIALKATTLSQKGLNAAMKANPIGMTIAIVMTAITAFTMLAAAIKKIGDRNTISPVEKATKAMENYNKQIEKNKCADDYFIRLAKAQGKSAKEINEMRKQQAQLNVELARTNYLNIANDYANASKKQRKEMEETKHQAAQALRDAKTNYNHLVNEIYLEETQATREHNEKLLEEQKRAAEERYQAKKEERKKQQELLDKYLNEPLDKEAEVAVKMDAQIQEEGQRALRILKQQQKDREDAEIAHIQAMAEKEDWDIEQKEQRAEEQKRINEELVASYQATSEAIASILGTYAELLGEDTEAYKNIKAAEAIISTISGAVSAFMGITKATNGLGIVAAVAQASAVLTAGYAQVKKIYAVDTKGGKNSFTATMKASSSALSALSTPITNVRQQTTASDIEQLPDTKVFVTIDDIQRGLHTKKATITNATI